MYTVLQSIKVKRFTKDIKRYTPKSFYDWSQFPENCNKKRTFEPKKYYGNSRNICKDFKFYLAEMNGMWYNNPINIDASNGIFNCCRIPETIRIDDV